MLTQAFWSRGGGGQPGGSLTVAKTVFGARASRTLYFSFTVTLSDSTYTASDRAVYTNNDSDSESMTISFVDGVSETFTMRHNESVTIYGLPLGVEYEVEEEAVSNYTTTATGETGTITEDDVTASFSNGVSSAGGGGGGGG